MKKNIYTILLLMISLMLLQTSAIKAQSQRKLAQTGLKFLSVSTDARVSGMGNAVTSVFGSSSSMLYNPAGMAEQTTSMDFSFGQTQWIADINYVHATASFIPFGEKYGVFGVSVVSVDYGDFLGTIRSGNDQGYIDIGTYSPSALAIGLSYARKLSDKFAIGGNIKYASQSLIDGGIVGVTDSGYDKEKFDIDVMAFDFGLIYRTGFKSLNLGMSVRNFSEELKYIEEGFQLPLTFRLGVSFNMMDLFDVDKSIHSFLLSVDASTPRDYDEQISIGGEYVFIDTFSLRAGYTTPTDEAGISFGLGVKRKVSGILMSVDYSYLDFGVFDSTHQFGVTIAY